MKKKLILIGATLLFIFIAVLPANAQQAGDPASKLPSLNPFCWKRRDCWEIRKKYLPGTPSESELNQGFITGATVAPCIGGEPGSQEEWGRCLPAGQTQTEISFGGKTQFANVGDFILLMYKYLITMASIVAVIVIIVAGMQWLTSGGNSETISGAKHRIGGAIIGLFIAYMSYFILNTINPAIVNFRLPQVWLAKPTALIPEFCKDIPGAKEKEVKFFSYRDSNPAAAFNNSYLGTEEIEYGAKGADGRDAFYCGASFVADGGGTQRCVGHTCEAEYVGSVRHMCSKDLDENKYVCSPGELFIHYSVDPFDLTVSEAAGRAAESIPVLRNCVTKAMETDWLHAHQVFRGVCKKENTLYLASEGRGKIWADDDKSKVPTLKKYSRNPYYEYDISFSKLVTEDSVSEDTARDQAFNDAVLDVVTFYQDNSGLTTQNWDCGQGGELVGFFLRNEVEVDRGCLGAIISLEGRTALPNLNIGYDRRTGQAVFGTFKDDIKTLNNYIPLDKLRDGGLRLEVRLNLDKILRMTDSPGSNPADDDKRNISPGVPVQ